MMKQTKNKYFVLEESGGQLFFHNIRTPVITVLRWTPPALHGQCDRRRFIIELLFDNSLVSCTTSETPNLLIVAMALIATLTAVCLMIALSILQEMMCIQVIFTFGFLFFFFCIQGWKKTVMRHFRFHLKKGLSIPILQQKRSCRFL